METFAGAMARFVFGGRDLRAERLIGLQRLAHDARIDPVLE
jgi:hypothetical protein